MDEASFVAQGQRGQSDRSIKLAGRTGSRRCGRHSDVDPRVSRRYSQKSFAERRGGEIAHDRGYDRRIVQSGWCEGVFPRYRTCDGKGGAGECCDFSGMGAYAEVLGQDVSDVELMEREVHLVEMEFKGS